VLSGELTLELDDGAERVVRAGEVIIQNGTRHRWHNRGTETAVIGCVMVGGTRTS
jgi:quercetin dioxygenase-like cupin family protein